jgi:hypothetical protein
MNMNKHVNRSSSSRYQQLEDETLVKNLVDRFENVYGINMLQKPLLKKLLSRS